MNDLKYVLQDLEATRFKDSPAFVSVSSGTTHRSRVAKRYTREQALEIQNRTRGRYRALPENAPLVEDNS